MSNSNSTSIGFLRRIHKGSTKGIFFIFTLLFVFFVVLFFLFLEHNHDLKNEQLIKRSDFRDEIKHLKYSLEKEANNSFQSSLLFNISNKETDRFQTIYALRATKDLFEQLRAKIEHTSDELDQELNVLSQLLKEYDQSIAASINRDGQLSGIIQKMKQPEDTSGITLLVDESIISMTPAEAKILLDGIEKIYNQLIKTESLINSKINKQIEDIKAESAIVLYIVFTIILVVLVFNLHLMVSGSQNSSISNLSSVLEHISKGELPDKDLQDEVGFNRIVDASKQLINYLDDASQFAIKIGDGDFGYEFKPKSDNDALGNSLIDMRNRLQEVAQEDKIRNWINEGQAKFGEILWQHSDDIDVLGNKVIIESVEYLDASQAALFILKEEADRQYLELLSSYAYNRKKFIDKKIEIGEGLAGQAFEEGKTIYLTDIKTDHYDIQTGLGESKPSSLLIVPLKQEDRIEGVIEIASLNEIKKYQIEFIESIGESIAVSLSTGKLNQTTRMLLEETQQKAEQMKAQEEELRQNMEELASTQEQMERRNKEMEEIQQKLFEEKYLLNALLTSTQDHIYFKDKDSKFIRVSNSMTELFNKKEEKEIIGKSDFDFGFEEHAKVAFADEQNIIKTGKPLIDVIEKETWDDGRISWVSTTKNPLRDLDGNIVGTFGISRDVTKNKEVELEMVKHKEWFEKFFKFYPVGFLVLNQKGAVSFASDSILSKLNISDLGNSSFEEMFRHKKFTDFLVDIDHENTKDSEVELSLTLNDKDKTVLDLTIISGSQENEDGTSNIFLIQK